MAKLGIGRIVWILIALVAVVVSFGAGLRQGQQGLMRTLQVEASGNLTQRIEVLSFLRMGDVPQAIDRLESESDQLTKSIAQNPSADKRALASVKTYLSVAPASPARAAELGPALEGVGVLDPGKCETALKALLLSAKRSPAAPGR